MKEFSAQTGGRYTYVDDIINLQELALAFSSIFDGCDNFIISGCNRSGTTISAGFVYLNGKVRYFAGATGISTWPQYIYEINSTETVTYVSGGDKVGRNIYGCGISNSVPTNIDPLTNAVPQYISFPSTGGLRIKDALFGRYALLLNARSGSQSVAGIVSFSGKVTVNGALNALGGVKVADGTTTGRMYNNNGQLVIESQIGSNGTVRQIVIDDSNNIAFFVGGNRVARITSSGIISEQTIQGVNLYGGNVYISGNHVYNRGTSSNGTLYINYNGYNGGTSYYRTTIIGNGKQGSLVEVNGADNKVSIFAPLLLASATSPGLILKAGQAKTSASLVKLIAWQDSNAEQIGYIGYNATDSNVFEIRNTLADILIMGQNAVDIGPAIKENGTLLSDKYVTLTTFNQQLGLKGDAANLYTSAEVEARLATEKADLQGQINTLKAPWGVGSNGPILKAGEAKTSNSLVKLIVWNDVNDEQIGYVGYNSDENKIFEIKNTLAEISIVGLGAVNIGPAIREGGTLLSEKYATIEYVNAQLSLKGNLADLYTATQVDNKVATEKADLQSKIDAITEPYGIVKMWAGSQVPAGYHLCNGDALNISDYPKLYAALGTTFNQAKDANGNQYSTQAGQFRLPDLRGRFIVGKFDTDEDYNAIGGVGGSKNVKITAAQSGVPAHNHGASATCSENGSHRHTWFGDDQLATFVQALGGEVGQAYGHYDADSTTSFGGSSFAYNTAANGVHSHNIAVTTQNNNTQDATEAHENRPPYYVLAFIMKID